MQSGPLHPESNHSFAQAAKERACWGGAAGAARRRVRASLCPLVPPRPGAKPSSEALVHHDGHRSSHRAPLEPEFAVLDEDRQLVCRCVQRAHAHLGAAKVVVLVMGGAPLTGFTVHDQLGGVARGQGEEGVITGRHMYRTHHQVAAGREGGCLVCPETPDLIRKWLDTVADHTISEVWPAVGNRQVCTADFPVDLDMWAARSSLVYGREGAAAEHDLR